MLTCSKTVCWRSFRARGTPSEAIKLAADLSQLLGAEHLFIDPVELDSMMSATHLLPQLMAAALLNATVDQPGWREARMLTGRPFAEATGPAVLFDQSGCPGPGCPGGQGTRAAQPGQPDR